MGHKLNPLIQIQWNAKTPKRQGIAQKTHKEFLGVFLGASASWRSIRL
jgi:hypothetical protein